MTALHRSSRGGNLQSQRERATATRDTILIVARTLFAQRGYHATGTTEIAAQAEVTRGALYHHFADKEALFLSVFQSVAEELAKRSSAAVAGLSGDLWPQVIEAFRQYLLLIAGNPDYRRILLVDGPVVLGSARWRDLQLQHVGARTADALQMLMDQGMVERQSPMPLATLIQAALHDAALTIANSPGSERLADEMVAAFLFVLQGIRKRG